MTAKKLAKAKAEAVSSEIQKTRAIVAVSPVVHSAAVIQAFSVAGKPDLSDLSAELWKEGDTVARGDMSNAERMLSGQAQALDAIFSKYARCAAANWQHLGAMEAYMRLALKAQSQCRTTWETLATMKNPPHVSFVKQANIAHGPQQVNNADSAPRGKTEIPPTELLGAPHASQWLDTRAPGTAGAGNPPLEAVAAVHRAADVDRQSEGEP